MDIMVHSLAWTACGQIQPGSRYLAGLKTKYIHPSVTPLGKYRCSSTEPSNQQPVDKIKHNLIVCAGSSYKQTSVSFTSFGPPNKPNCLACVQWQGSVQHKLTMSP